MTGNFAWLFRRRSYEGLLASWNTQGGRFKDALNNRRKYVASRNPSTTLDWPNVVLHRPTGSGSDAAADVCQAGENLETMSV